jgi:hypothetical protein
MTELIRIGQLEIRFLHTKEGTGGALDLFELAVPAGAKVPVPHYHRDYDETVYGLRRARLDAGRRAARGRPRRGPVHPPRRRAPIRNPHAETARALVVLTPGLVGPAYFREVAALAFPGSPPVPARVREVMLCHGLVPDPE